MTPAEYVAQRTWNTLAHAQALRARLGEETLTDLLMLDMLPHRRVKSFWLWSTTKHAEAQIGADLLVVVRHPTGLWSRLALQAKKLYPNNNYRTLNSGQKCKAQFKKLERFARQQHALPVYLLYNHTGAAQKSLHWHCQKQFVVEQLGCTLVPSWHIRRVMQRWSARTFDSANSISQSIPWCCAFNCRHGANTLAQMGYGPPVRGHKISLSEEAQPEIQYDWSFEPLETCWPDWLFSLTRSELTRDDLKRLRTDILEASGPYARDASRNAIGSEDDQMYPARLLAVDQVERPER